MGNCGSLPEGEAAGASAPASGGGFSETEIAERRSKVLDKEIRDLERRQATEIKILLLGAGESGKTTILKQMRVIHELGFTAEETEQYRRQVFMNIWDAMRSCLEGMQELDIRLSVESNRDHLYLFEEQPVLSEGQAYPTDLLQPLKDLCADEGVQSVMRRSNEAILPDSTAYFFSDLERFFSAGYRPTNDDIFRVRGKTTGITETIFMHKSLTYRMFDVGGQRSERRKWIHCFEASHNVTAVLFLASISGYDQGLIEDRDSNQMQEALMLFDSICNSTCFLNKIDIFKEKILNSPISAHFLDYTGSDTDYNASREYFKQRFTKLNRSKSKDIYCSFTTAIDTTLLRVVMITVQDTILQRNLAVITF
ncbi:MAG: hypothetical protein CYPHOPRED_000773 [Cyphobasidiales sp. Tagirdzhanova-0007]|nr:MAG: hypothetical protein CYPHOPRED_000773 [Cyphobasidiales sp. Tagirdzhanova-0007]